MNIDGHWQGVYVQSNGPRAALPFELGRDEYAISVDFRIEGGRLTGAMTDVDRVFEMTVQQMFEHGRNEMTPNMVRDYDKFLAAYPEAVIRMEYPEQSDLNGRLVEDRLTFTKEYLGGLQQTFTLSPDGEPEPSQSEPMSTVHYSGVVSQDGSLIEGTWEIRNSGPLGKWKAPIYSGPFRLRRFPKLD